MAVPVARRLSATALAALAVVAVACGSSQHTTAGANPASTGTSPPSTAGSTTATAGTSSTTAGGTVATTNGTAGPAASTVAQASTAAEATTTVRLTVAPGEGGGAFTTSRSVNVPAGWTAEVWSRVSDARMETWTPQGDLLVSAPGRGRVIELTPKADPQSAPTQTTILSGLTQPQGLAFAQVDGHEVLYVGESDQIDKYVWNGRTVGARTVIAKNLPDQDPAGDDVHRQKDVAVAPDGTVYFNVGSSSNANPDDRLLSPQRAVIMAVNPDGSNLHVVERGVRNGEGLSVAPNGTVWTAVNNRDNVTYPLTGSYDGQSNAFGKVIQSYVDEHPVDEVAPVTQGRDLGWPYCNPDPDDATPAGSDANVPFVADAVTNPHDRALNCATLPPIEVGLPAHSAPVGLDFLEGSKLPAAWTGGAVVAVHGSWDRQPPRAPAVLWMAWDSATESLTPAATLVGGFQNADGSRWGRPVDAVPGPDGALYVSDDSAGAIYRLVPAAAK